MKYGCIGEHLRHSFSKEIHALIGEYEYAIREIPKNEVDTFMKEKDFLGINVTIPYKQTVIPYLEKIDEGAKLIGAVNTVVNRDGKLYGYNTDFYGMSKLIKRADISIKDKKVLILGSGGTSKTAHAVAMAMGAKEVIKASRKEAADTVLYSDVYEHHTDADVIINTTPVGMFPEIFASAIDISKFKNLSGVVDAVYNPQRTPLVLAALKRGVKATGGLYMLVAQAVRASEIFLDKKYPDNVCEDIYKKVASAKENIVLIGMPASGKTTVGNILAGKLSRKIIDTDEMIVKSENRSIPDIFSAVGEVGFRDIESDVVKRVSSEVGAIIATGGGAVLRKENVDALKENGRLFFLDRSPQLLIPTADRPLSSNKEDIQRRYNERYPIYVSAADEHINADCDASSVAEKILELL